MKGFTFNPFARSIQIGFLVMGTLMFAVDLYHVTQLEHSYFVVHRIGFFSALALSIASGLGFKLGYLQFQKLRVLHEYGLSYSKKHVGKGFGTILGMILFLVGTVGIPLMFSTNPPGEVRDWCERFMIGFICLNVADGLYRWNRFKATLPVLS